MIGTLGRHLLVEYRGCAGNILNDYDKIESMLQRAAIAAGATLVGKVFHQFTPIGVSGVVVVQESHISIHTWPEEGYAAVDFYTCGDCKPERAHELLLEELEATEFELLTVRRGAHLPRSSAWMTPGCGMAWPSRQSSWVS